MKDVIVANPISLVRGIRDPMDQIKDFRSSRVGHDGLALNEDDFNPSGNAVAFRATPSSPAERPAFRGDFHADVTELTPALLGQDISLARLVAWLG